MTWKRAAEPFPSQAWKGRLPLCETHHQFSPSSSKEAVWASAQICSARSGAQRASDAFTFLASCGGPDDSSFSFGGGKFYAPWLQVHPKSGLGEQPTPLLSLCWRIAQDSMYWGPAAFQAVTFSSVMWLFCGLCGLLERMGWRGAGGKTEQYQKEKVPQVLGRVPTHMKIHKKENKGMCPPTEKTGNCFHNDSL